MTFKESNDQGIHEREEFYYFAIKTLCKIYICWYIVLALLFVLWTKKIAQLTKGNVELEIEHLGI